jgi:ketosteroid isomerase-like protein
VSSGHGIPREHRPGFFEARGQRPRFYATGDGGTVFVECKGDLILAETGTPYHNVYIFKVTFRDGQIMHIAEYANPVTFAKLVGMPLG